MTCQNGNSPHVRVRILGVLKIVCGWANKTWLLQYACCGLHFADSAACVLSFYHSTPLHKQAKIIPTYKSGDYKNPSNYRPISILSVLSKPLEKHINKHQSVSYLKTNELIHPNQSGFREHHSCHTALTTLEDIFYKNINNNEFTGVLFVDFERHLMSLIMIHFWGN